MKRLASLLVLPALVGLGPVPAHAGSSTDAALGLGAFAVFNQIVRGETIFHGPGRPVVRERVVYVPAPPPAVVYAPPPPPVVYAPAPVYYAPPPPPVYAPAPVVYPHGYWMPQRGRWLWVARHPGHHHGHHAYYHR
jgi:hypothetical protein